MTPERRRILLIGVLVSLTTGLHYLTPHHAGALHEIWSRLYYLPVILAGIWFGVRGGLLTALAISVVYLPHAWHGWQAPYTPFYRLTEIGMYYGIGGLTGWLAGRLRAETARLAESQRQLEAAFHEREQAFQALRQKTEELFTVEEQLRHADRMAALGRLTASLAHEIRNPLASIKATVELLEEQLQERGAGGEGTHAPARPAEEEGTLQEGELIEVLLEETDRLNHVLTNVLSFTRSETAEGDAPRCIIAEAVDSVAALLRKPLETHGIQLECAHQGDDLVAAMGESQVKQVLMNLFLNAIQAMPEGGAIRVTVLREDEGKPEGMIGVIVSDTGPGIAAEHLPRIFEPFYSTRPDGTGLGLAIVERILASHGGTIAVVPSATEGGATFHIRLPGAGR